VAAYGATALVGPWRTSDGVVPYVVFVLLLQQLPALEAGGQLAGVQGTALGIGLALGGGSEAQAQLDNLERLALGGSIDG
jgi:hypothetical protein